MVSNWGLRNAGADVCAELTSRGIEYDAPDRDRLDICSPAEIAAFLDEMEPEAVVNCAAYTAVDATEENEGVAFTLNATAPQYLAQATAERESLLVQISTDYVFSGTSSTPYAEDAPLHPLNILRADQIQSGEWAVRLRLTRRRTLSAAWLCTVRAGRAFRTLARVLKKNGTANVVDDQHGQPTWTVDVARIVVDLVTSARRSASIMRRARAVQHGLRSPRRSQPRSGSGRGCSSRQRFPRPAPRPGGHCLLMVLWRRPG